jgi:large subunit ribosomal protein L30
VADKQAKTKAKSRRKKKEVKLRIKWVKSSIGYSQRQKATIKSLGLKRLGDTVEWKNDPVTRGMVDRVRHLVEVEEVVAGD